LVPTIWEVAKAVRESDLTAPARHIVLTLAFRADATTGVVPERWTPSLTELAHDTGLGRSTVAEGLSKLEAGGWLERRRPELKAAWVDKAKTQYVLLVPPTAHDATGPGAGLVQEMDQPDRDMSAETGTESEGGDWSRSWTSPGDGPALVQELDGTSPGAGPVLEPKNNQVVSPSERQTRVRARTPASQENATSISLLPGLDQATKPRSTQTTVPDRFDEFWAAYPRKKDKGHARTAWAKALKRGADPQKIIAAAAAFRADPERIRSGDQYTPYPSTWLNGERYSDEPDQTPRAAASNGYVPFRNPTDPHAYDGDL
jgi:hypothetical protein